MVRRKNVIGTDSRLSALKMWTTARQRFTLSIYEKDDAGYESLLEGYEVGIGEDDKDDHGAPRLYRNRL